MIIGKRIEKLEQKVGTPQEEPRFLVFTLVKRDGQGNLVKRIPTEEAFEKAGKEAIERQPGKPVYILSNFENYYERVVPEKRED